MEDIKATIRLTSLFASQCNESIHWFTNTVDSLAENISGEPPPDMECNCGKTKWKDFNTLKALEGKDVQIIEDGL